MPDLRRVSDPALAALSTSRQLRDRVVQIEAGGSEVGGTAHTHSQAEVAGLVERLAQMQAQIDALLAG